MSYLSNVLNFSQMFLRINKGSKCFNGILVSKGGVRMFEDRLKDLRKKKGVTQTQVAESIYVSRSLIAKFETGAAYPNRETLEKLALYFDVQVSELIDQDETTLVAVEAKDISEKINFVATISILIIAAIYSFIVFIPMLKGSRYIYPIPPGQDYPNREYFFTSIFRGRSSAAIRLV